MQACYSSEADGIMPIPWRISEALPAYPRPLQRGDAGSEGVILRASCNEALTFGHDLEPSLSSQELPPIIALGYPACCPPAPAGGLGAGAHTRHPPRLEGARTRRHRCAGDVQRCYHVHTFVHRLHLWVSPYSNSGRRRAIYAADHSDDLTARQRHPLHGWPFRFHVPFRNQGFGPNGDDCSPIGRVRHRAPWFNLHRSFPVFDRLRGENAAPGQFDTARGGSTGSR